MCMVSAVLDYGRQNWQPSLGNHYPPLTAPVVGWAEYQELLRKAAEFDHITQQPDCHDPEKAKWYTEMEERVRKLEAEKSA